MLPFSEGKYMPNIVILYKNDYTSYEPAQQPQGNLEKKKVYKGLIKQNYSDIKQK